MSPHMQSSGSCHQLSLRRSARLAAKRASMPEPPVMKTVPPPQIGAKRPLSCPSYPPCKHIRLMVHQQPSMHVHLCSAFVASRSSACAVHSAADGPRLVHDPGGYWTLLIFRGCRWLHPRPRLAGLSQSFIHLCTGSKTDCKMMMMTGLIMQQRLASSAVTHMESVPRSAALGHGFALHVSEHGLMC